VEPTLSQGIADQLAGISCRTLGLVEAQRLVKSPHEVARLRQAAHYPDPGMQKIMAPPTPG